MPIKINCDNPIEEKKKTAMNRKEMKKRAF